MFYEVKRCAGKVEKRARYERCVYIHYVKDTLLEVMNMKMLM